MKVGKFLAAGMLMIIALPFSVQAKSYSEQITQMVSQYPISRQEIRIDTKSERVYINGKQTSLAEELEISQSDEKMLLNNASRLNAVMDEYGYFKDTEKEGAIIYKSRFRAKRLIVYHDTPVKNQYNAVQSVIKDEHTLILQYAEVSDAEQAYEELIKDGFDVVIDEIITTDDLSYLDGASTCHDNGVSIMGMDDMQKNPIYQKNTVVAAVIDTGIKPSALSSSRIIGDVNLSGGSSVTSFHGSGVCGVILDSTAENVKILSINVFDETGSSSYLIVESAINYAVNHGADVINMSLALKVGEETKDVTVWNKAIDNAISEGIPVVVAAGNEETSTDYAYPACYEPCWTIGATTKNKTRAYFSNYGNIDFAAPGASINLVYGNDSGTSFASPYVVAFACLLKGKKTYKSVDEQFEDMKRYCEDLGAVGYDQYFGFGMPVFKDITCAEGLHKWTGTVIQTQTCTNPEITHYICSVCETEKTEQSKDVLGHSYQETSRIAATCSATGKIYYKCSSCGTVKREEIALDSSKHTYRTERKESTTTEKGYIKNICTLCGNTVTYMLPLLEPELTEEEQTDPPVEKPAPAEEPAPESGSSTEAENTDTRLKEAAKNKKAKIKQAVNKKGKKIRITLKKEAGYSYQIQLSTSKKFKKSMKTYKTSQTSYTVKKLKKKTYYVRVRTYKTIAGSKIYGKWSAVKKVRVKK